MEQSIDYMFATPCATFSAIAGGVIGLVAALYPWSSLWVA